jgi:hypothetical protein
MIGLAGTIANPDHVAGGGVPVAGLGRILTRQGLLESEQQRLGRADEVIELDTEEHFWAIPLNLRLFSHVADPESVAPRASWSPAEHHTHRKNWAVAK